MNEGTGKLFLPLLKRAYKLCITLIIASYSDSNIFVQESCTDWPERNEHGEYPLVVSS